MFSRKPAQKVGAATIMQQVAPYMALGSQLTVTVLLLGGIGWLVDDRLGWTPWGLISGLLVGSGVGFVQFLRSVQRLLNASQQQKK